MLLAMLRTFTRGRQPAQSNPVVKTAVEREEAGHPAWDDWAFSVDRAFFSVMTGKTADPDAGMSKHERQLLAGIEKEFLRHSNVQEHLPRMPDVIPRVMQAMRDSNVNVENLDSLLSKDIVLSGELVRLSNSAYYGRGREVQSLDDAIVSIGFEGLRKMLVSVMMKPILEDGSQAKQADLKLWSTSMSIAMTSDAIAARMRINRFHAYIVTVMSQAGMSILLRFVNKHLDCDTVSTDFVDALNLFSVRLSAHISKCWAFPDEAGEAWMSCVQNHPPQTLSPLAQLAFFSSKYIRIEMLNTRYPLNRDSSLEFYDCGCEIGKLLSEEGEADNGESNL